MVTDDAYFGLFYGEDVYQESLFARLAADQNALNPAELKAVCDHLWRYTVQRALGRAWEMMGMRLERPFPVYLDGFPPEVMEAFERETGLSRAEVIEKARDLTTPILGREKTERLIKTAYAIETVTDVRSLRPLIQRG